MGGQVFGRYGGDRASVVKGVKWYFYVVVKAVLGLEGDMEREV